MEKITKILLMLALATAPTMVGCSDDSDDSGSGGDMETGGSESGGTMETGGSATGGSETGGSETGGSETGGMGATGGMMADECDLSRGSKDVVELSGDLDTQTLTSDKVYQLKEYVYVPDGKTVTIEPCTRIEGLPAGSGLPGTLIVSRGGKLMAEGEADKPILFTSVDDVGQRETATWGGVILLGKAPSFLDTDVLIEGLEAGEKNYYGGTTLDDNSGTLKYVRIEFGGAIIGTDNEINGLSLGGVGSGTTLSHIMVNTTEDDCFEFFGGTVNADHLICNNQGDDMFDTDEGFKGTLTYLFGRAKDDLSSNPNGFEMDSDKTDDSDTLAHPRTFVTAEHVTLCGSGNTGSATTFGMVLRENLTGKFDDLVVLGFDYAADARDSFGTADMPSVELTNALFFDANIDLFGDESGAADNDMGFSEQDWFDMGTGNETPDPVPFTVADCTDEAGPKAAVTDSGVGAFTDSADWATGMWVDWATE